MKVFYIAAMAVICWLAVIGMFVQFIMPAFKLLTSYLV